MIENASGRVRWLLIGPAGAATVAIAVVVWLSWPQPSFQDLIQAIGKNTHGLAEFRHKQSGIVFVRVPGGTFQMGSPSSEEGRDDDEGPVHQVMLSPFLIAKYEVTQAEWKRVMGANPSRIKGDDLPVETVSWNDCQEFCRKTGLKLPTEAQWEYACRAGTSTPYAGTDRLDDMGWYGANSNDTSHPGGRKAPNGFGIYDMHGNVWEWCEDKYDWIFYTTSAAREKDPVCTEGPKERVDRGGCWYSSADLCRSASRTAGFRGYTIDGLGFRPVFFPLP